MIWIHVERAGSKQNGPHPKIFFGGSEKIGDQSDFFDTNVQEDIVVIILTSDVKEKLERENFQYEGEKWTTIHSYKGACEILVRTDVVDNLDASIPWTTPLIESTV